MKARYLAALQFILFGIFAYALGAAEPAAQKPLSIPDMVAWKRIASPTVSANGEWFAYRLAPAEGDGEVVLRNLNTGKEERFAIGEPTGGESTYPALSADSKWLAYFSYATQKEAKAAKKAKKPLQSKVVLVELATGKKTEFEKARRFAFNGERASAFAVLRAQANPPAAAPAPGAADDRPTGADLLLVDLETGAQLNTGNVADFAFDKPGNWLAWTVDAADKAGNGIALRNLTTGVVQALDSAAATYRGLGFTEKGDALAVLRGVEDKAWEDKLYSVVGFKMAGGAAPPAKTVFDPKDDPAFPKGFGVSPNRTPAWREDLSALVFGIQELKPKKGGDKKESEDAPDLPDLAVWHWKDPRLQPQQQVEEQGDKSFSFLSLYRPVEKKFVRLADEHTRIVNWDRDQKFAIGRDNSEYQLQANLDGKSYNDIFVIDPETGARRRALRKERWPQAASPDGTKLLHYEDGVFYMWDSANNHSYPLTRNIASEFWDAEDDHNVVKPPANVMGWSKDSRYALISDGWDIWKIAVIGGDTVNLTGNGKRDKIRYQSRFRLDPDERGGIDLSQPLYISAISELTKERGIGVIEPGQPGVKRLLWGPAAFQQLMKAKKADVYLYTREDTQSPPDFYVTGRTLEGGKKITDSNPQQRDYRWTSGVRVLEFTSTGGEKLRAALWLPANYEPGKRYPAITYIYEKLTQGTYSYPFPAYNGFNIAHYTSNGYAVLEPDITYKVNDPGLSAVACVVPAVKAAIATGVVDAARVGIQGHSWGGYQTAFLVTQTDVFAAAVAGAPLTNMISMYSAIYWNSGMSNQPIFESSQGRFAGNYLDNMDAYVRNSPVFKAGNVKTPLLLLHNDKDGAVDHTQGIEFYNTLRRLGKTVVMLEYKGENHNLRQPENMKDYTLRMREWFDHYLMAKPSSKWMEQGVPRLEIKQHLEERAKETAKPAEKPVAEAKPATPSPEPAKPAASAPEATKPAPTAAPVVAPVAAPPAPAPTPTPAAAEKPATAQPKPEAAPKPVTQPQKP